MNDQISHVCLRALERHLGKDTERLLVCVQQRLDTRPLGNERLVLVQQLGKQVGLVQRRHQPLLHGVTREVDLGQVLAMQSRVCTTTHTHQEVHDGLGNQVLDRLADDTKVGRNQRADQVGLH